MNNHIGKRVQDIVAFFPQGEPTEPNLLSFAAAEATAKIHVQKLLEGSSKTSSGNSPSLATSRRRRFGGFAGSTIPPPALIQFLPASIDQQITKIPRTLPSRCVYYT
jgi:hypothetical protein